MSDIPKAFFNRSLILTVKQYPSYYIEDCHVDTNSKNFR